MPSLQSVVHLIRPQIAGFCACAAASGIMLLLLRRIPEAARQSLWPLFGWFSGLMCCGSCAGAAAWTAFLQDRTLFYTFVSADITASSVIAKTRNYYMQADEARWRAAFFILYALPLPLQPPPHIAGAQVRH